MVSISYGHGKLYDFDSEFLFQGSTTYTTSAQGGVGNDTTIDASLTQGDDYWNGCYIKFLSATNAANVGITREITDFDSGTDTLTHDAFPARTENGDTFVLSAWQLIEDGQTLATPVCLHGDYVDVEATGTGGNAVGYINNFTNLGLSSLTFTKIRWRYSTSDTSVKAKIVLEFSDTTTQTVLDQSSSTSMTSGTATITTAKIVDHVRLHCDATTGHVYYDFTLIHKDDFTFPNCAGGVIEYPPERHVDLGIPSRQTDVTQYLGSPNWYCTVGCDLTKGDWKRTGDTVDGQVFRDIVANANSEAWQWLDLTATQILDATRLKVTLRKPHFIRGASGERLIHEFRGEFHEYRLSSGDNSLESYVTQYGLDL